MTAMARSLVCVVAAVSLGGAAAAPARAQQAEGGRLTGRVTDGSGAALPGVTVTLRPTGPGRPDDPGHRWRRPVRLADAAARPLRRDASS